MRIEVDGQHFDVPDDATPDEIDSLTKPPAPKVSGATAFGRGAAQGATLGLGERLQGAIQAALPVPGDPATFAERFRRQHGAAMADDDAAKAAHPLAYGGGQVVGGVAPTVLLPIARAAQGAGLAARAGISALNAAPVGALISGAESRADTLGGMAGDALKGGAVAAVTAGALPVLGAALRPAAESLSSALRNTAIAQGRKAISGVANALTARKQIPAEAVQQALDTGAIRPFAGVEGIAKRLGSQAEDLGSQYGDILDQLASRGVHGPDAEALATKLSQQAQDAAQNSLNSVRPKMLQSTADELAGKALPISGRGRLGLMQSEEMKRTLQQEASREYDKLSGKLTIPGETKKEIAGVMKDAIEQAVQDQSSLAPEAAAAFQPVKERLSRVYAALGPAEEGAARAARRSPISLPSTIVGGVVGEHNPLLAIPAALLHGTVKHRLPSTASSLANTGANALLSVPSMSPEAARLSALAAALQRWTSAPGLVPASADEGAAR